MPTADTKYIIHTIEQSIIPREISILSTKLTWVVQYQHGSTYVYSLFKHPWYFPLYTLHLLPNNRLFLRIVAGNIRFFACCAFEQLRVCAYIHLSCSFYDYYRCWSLFPSARTMSPLFEPVFVLFVVAMLPLCHVSTYAAPVARKCSLNTPPSP